MLETNVHFPTDLNLLWDSLRKCLDVIEAACREDKRTEGWRKIKSIRRQIKCQFRRTSQQVFKGRNEKVRHESVKAYLQLARQLQKRFHGMLQSLDGAPAAQLRYYSEYVTLFVHQIDRRLLKEETIQAEEKIYSIFEPHTEWISKGKSNPTFELGHNLLITTEQSGIIMDYKIMEQEKDVAQIEALTKRLKKSYPDMKIYSHSFDKGFFSRENWEWLSKASWAEHIILPKRGKLAEEEKIREHTTEFRKLRYAHSAIESNINMLEHHGLDRCPDKGLRGYKRYVGLSVLACNLHIIGNHLIAREKQKQDKPARRPAA